MSDLVRRTFTAHLTTRAEDTADGRTVTGTAVPLDTPTQIMPGYREQIARGAVDTSRMPMLFYRHDEPIGVVTALAETDAGLEMTARISETTLGRDAAILAADGAISALSIGFYEIDYEDTTDDDGTLLRTQTRIDLREISLVPIPAYDTARITNVRSHREGTPTMSDQTPDLDTLTRSLEDLTTATTALERRMSLVEATGGPATDPSPETRTGGTLLKLAMAGDEAARSALAPFVGRAFTGTTTSADARYTEPTFIADLTRLVILANPLMNLFSTGTLPAEGNTLEFAQIKSNTIEVTKQSAEGTTLPTGTVTTETKTATIDTYGGGATLSRQVIERSRSNILDLHLRALTLTAAKTLAADFATVFASTVAANLSNAITATKPAASLDWKSVLHLMLDAQDAYEDQALVCDGLILDRLTFEALVGMTDTTGRPILTVAGNTGGNTIGTVSAQGRYADLDGLRVVTNRYLTTDMGEGVTGSFYNADALRTYTSGLVSLQDTSVLDLTQAFSVYQYAAFAPEIPEALVPVKMGA